MDNIKTISTEVIQTVDQSSGEIIDIQTKTVKMLFDSDKFCLAYAGLWNILLETPLSKSDIELFAYLIQEYGHGCEFCVTDNIKNNVAIRAGKNKTSYNNSVRALLKYKIIYNVSKKSYKINPRYIFEGSSKDRNKFVIEMTSKCKNC